VIISIKKLIFAGVLLVFWAMPAYAQLLALKAAAAEARDTGNLPGACLALQHALLEAPIDFEVNYNLARNYALLGKNDSAFYYLFLSVSLRKDFNMLRNPDFLLLVADPRWNKLKPEIYADYFKQNPRYEKELTLQLAGIQMLDEAYDWQLHVMELKHMANSSLIKQYQRLKDSINEVTRQQLEGIVKAKGWPKASLVGRLGMETAFHVMQHADAREQVQSNQRILQEPVKNEEVLFHDTIPVRPFLKGGLIPYQFFARSSGIYFEYSLQRHFSLEFRLAYTYRQNNLEERYQYALSVRGYFLYSGENAYLAWYGKAGKWMKFSMLIGQRYWEYFDEWLPQSKALAPGSYIYQECKSSYLFGLGIGFGFGLDLSQKSSWLDCEYFMNALFMQCWIRDNYSNAEGYGAPPHPPYSYKIYPKQENRLTLQPLLAIGLKLGLKKAR
jgi:hypothetical protein